MANVSSAVRQTGNILCLLVLWCVYGNRYQEKVRVAISNVVVGITHAKNLCPLDSPVAGFLTLRTVLAFPSPISSALVSSCFVPTSRAPVTPCPPTPIVTPALSTLGRPSRPPYPRISPWPPARAHTLVKRSSRRP